jgi:uncharacterized protein (DUF1015 family)
LRLDNWSLSRTIEDLQKIVLSTSQGIPGMIRFYPFRALMPPPADAARIACEPYDVISTEEARERSAGNPKSFLHVVRSEIDLPEDTDPHDAAVYDVAAKNLQSMIDSGLLVEQPDPSLFIYRQTWQGREQYGVVGCCDAAQYRSDHIKKHEKTRPDKEDDRTRHMTTCSAHAEPVFLTFHDTDRIGKLIKSDSSGTPMLDFTANDGVGHTVWQVADSQAYVDAFTELDALYIADGHHRTAGGERAATERQRANPKHTGNEEYNRILTVAFPASHLRILAYNRIVKDLGGMTREELMAKLAGVGMISPTTGPVPPKAGSVCVYAGSGWHLLEFPASSIDHSDPINSLDVSLLQSRVLEPVLAVGDPRTDSRIGFVGGIRGTKELEKLVDSGKAGVAFSMFPTSIEQLLNVSDAGQIMPPKSTWFEPKLRSGLFVHQFERV